MTVRKVTINANVPWIVFPSSTSKHLIAVCDPLNLSLEAVDEEELRSLIPEALHALFSDLFADNELDAYLREKGWQAANLPARPDGDVKFHVPWHIAQGVQNGIERCSH
jgi:hypothetical protein